jgi:citryl-CoA synthetase large subunit
MKNYIVSEFTKTRELFDSHIRGQYVAAVLIEEKLSILEEQYVSIVYDTNRKQPMLIYSCAGGMDIEDVADYKIKKFPLDIRETTIDIDVPYAQELWKCFLAEDTRQIEINPLVKTHEGKFVAADAKVAIDDDAFYRHPSINSGPQVTDWKNFEPRTMLGRLPTERELAVKKIDEGEAYYRGTAGKYIELDGDIALILNGGGASIANMDALVAVGLKPANYTEYSGNPPREKVYQLAKIVLSKPGIRGLWMCGVVANFTNMKDTFSGIIDALDEIKPQYPIVVRRDGPESVEAFELMRACGERNHLNMKLFNKDMSMSESAQVLANMIYHK